MATLTASQPKTIDHDLSRSTGAATTCDVLVIGAGIAGCGIASALAKQGRRVIVVERNLDEPDRIVGELLQPGGVAALRRLGLEHCLEGIEATPVEGYHLYWKDDQATFWFCPVPAGEKGSLDRPTGRSFHHGKFVGRLRAAVAREPNATLVETTAVELLRDRRTGTVTGAVCSLLGNPTHEYHASLTILADGGASNFRSQFTPYRPKALSSFWALEMTDANLPRHGYAYGVLGAAPPMLMYQISARHTRILIDIPDTTHRRLGTNRAVRAYIRDSIVPIVPSSVRPSLQKAIQEGRFRSMPNAWLPSTRNSTPGLLMLSDAANMRHPVTGAGMTVALKDVVLLAELLSPKHIPSLADRGAALKVLWWFHWRRKAHSATLNILAQALYLLFVSEDPAMVIMQRGFINYVQQGEKYFAQPAWLMGGIVDVPLLLFYHFFRVALHSVGLHLRHASLLELPAALFQSVMLFASAIAIIWRPILDELCP